MIHGSRSGVRPCLMSGCRSGSVHGPLVSYSRMGGSPPCRQTSRMGTRRSGREPETWILRDAGCDMGPPFAGINQVRFMRSAAPAALSARFPELPRLLMAGRLLRQHRSFKRAARSARMTRMDAVAVSRRRFVSRLAAHVVVRFHMGLIFAATSAAAVLATWLLMRMGVDALSLRYGLAVVTAYLVFFLLVRLWIDYVTSVGVRDGRLGLPDVAPTGGRGGEPGAFTPQGGRFGGGGASVSLDEPPVYRSLAEARNATAVRAGGRGGGDVGDGDWISLDPRSE